MIGESSPGQDADQASDGMLVTHSMDEFEAELSRRAKVPAPKLTELLTHSEPQIRRETEAVTAILKRFARAVVDSMDDPSGVDRFLRELDLKAISRDHHWRTIFAELRFRDDRFEQHKRVLVIKYLQYLSFRKKLLEYIQERKAGLEETDNHPDLTIFPAPDHPERDKNEGMAKPVGEFTRIPIGSSVRVVMGTASVPVVLGRRVFKILPGAYPCLVDPNGVTHFLKDGRNMVGRHPESDAVIDRDFNDVSRAHAIFEWDGKSVVTITDLSTPGTFISSDLMSAGTENPLAS